MLVTDPKSAKEVYGDALKVYGYPDTWVCIAKASVPGHWMKSTKAMAVSGLGVLVQVTTEVGHKGGTSIAEALTFIPGACIIKTPAGHYELGSYEHGMMAYEEENKK